MGIVNNCGFSFTIGKIPHLKNENLTCQNGKLSLIMFILLIYLTEQFSLQLN